MKTAKSDVEAGYASISLAVETCVAAIERHGGTVNKILGDGVMATFGAPVMLEDHASRACRCALDIQAKLATLGKSRSGVHMRIGIHSGTALITEDVDGSHTSFDAHGPTVNLAKRIEAEAKPDAIYISENTFRLVWYAFACQNLSARVLKGFEEATALYELLHEKAHEQLRGLSRHKIETPFLGREGDLALASQILGRLQHGIGGFLLILGEAGVGKSRFLAEMRHALPEGTRWFVGHCEAFTERVSFWPFIELLRTVLGMGAPALPAEQFSPLEQTLTELLGHDAQELLPYIATFLGLTVPAADHERLQRLDAEVLGAQIFRAARRLFEAFAQRQPVVLVLEDLHWADLSSQQLLEHLLPLARALPILFVVLSRPDPERTTPLREAALLALSPESFEEIVLAPLSAAETQQLLVAILGKDERFARLRDRILYKVEGNPFFLEEVIRELIDLRVLVHDDQLGTWSAHDLDIAIPQTVEGVLMARIDRLDERLRDILGIASVLGRTFFYRLLRTATNAEIDEPLAKLSAAEMIRELRTTPELAYLFRHALTHQAVYDSLLVERRRQLHGLVAKILEDLYVGRLHEITSLLAFHYARAQDPEHALTYLVAAAQQSGRMAADGEALSLLEEAVASYWNAGGEGPDAEQRAKIELQLGDIHFRRGDHERAEEHLVRAIEAVGSRVPRGRSTLNLAILGEAIRHALDTIVGATRAPKYVKQINPAEEVRLRVYESLGWIYFLSDHRRLLHMVLCSANHAAQIGYPDRIARTTAALGLGISLAGWKRVASSYYRYAQSIAGTTGDLASSAFVKMCLANHLFVYGSWSEARQMLEETRLSADRIGDLLIWSDASAQICEILSEMGEFPRALQLSETMIERGKEAAFRPALRWGLMLRGKALRRSGLTTEAQYVLDEAFSMNIADKDIIGTTSTAGDLALAMIALGRQEEAERLLRELRGRIIKGEIRMYTVCSVYGALAELALRHFEASPESGWNARSACDEVWRLGRTFSMARPTALRLQGRLAWLSRRRRRAVRLWRQAAAVAGALGARYELGLIHAELTACGVKL